MKSDIYTKIDSEFNLDSLNIIKDACLYASSKGHKVCNSLHLTVILLGNEIVKKILEQLDFAPEELRLKVLENLKNITYPFQISDGKVVFTPDLRATILRSYLFEKEIPNGIVGPEDLLLGTIFSPPLQTIIRENNLDISNIENLVHTVKDNLQKQSATSPVTIKRFTIDLTQRAREGKLDKIIGRETELAQLLRVLTRESKNNVILLGETGVGRSSVVHLLAQKINAKEITGQLQSASILELNLSGLITSLASRGLNELVDKLKEEITEFEKAIVFIKNFTLSSSKSIEETLVLNLLKSLLETEGVRFVMTTSTSSYKQLLATDPNFNLNFEIVKVSEPSADLTMKILQKRGVKFSGFHNISIDSNVYETCVVLSQRYLQDKFLPAKAIDLLDETCSKVAQEGKNKVTVEDLKIVISEKTGVPVEKLTESESQKLINLEELLNKQVIGQKDAVHAISEVVRRSRAGLKDPKKPIGSFLFLGPSGVGKTYLAKNLTRIVYDNENAMIRLDMSEFSESHTVQRLIGSPPGYVGYEEGGQLTNPIWERPYSLILLDEIEKAHQKVFDIFLQVLDEGRLTDGQGRTVDFKNTIIIATSNIASEEILEKQAKLDPNTESFEKERFYEEQILPLLKNYFRPEFINRFDEVVIFNPLSKEELKEIAKLQIEKLQDRLKEKSIIINISEQKLADLAERSFKPAFGARPLIRLIQDEIENSLARKIISGEIKEGETVNL